MLMVLGLQIIIIVIRSILMMEQAKESQHHQFAPEKIINLQSVTVKLIDELYLTEKAKKIPTQAKLRALSEINGNLFSLLKLSSAAVEAFARDELIVYVRYFLIDSASKIPAIQFFRLILVSEAVVKKLIHHSLPIYLGRIIEKDEPGRLKQTNSANYEGEVIQTLKLIQSWLERFPKTFPQYLAFCLVALTELPVLTTFEQKKKDHISQHIKILILRIIQTMSIKNTELCCICGGFTFLVNAITDPNLQEESYDILSKLLLFVNDPSNREITSSYIDFKKIFYLVTDLDNIFLEEGFKIRSNFDLLGKFHSRLKLAKGAIITLFKSWAGLIYLGSDPRTIGSFLEILKQIPKKSDSQMRGIVFDILEEILSVGDYILVASASEEKGIFRMSNLLGCYLMTVVELLMEQDLLRILIQLSGVQQANISEPSQRLLKRLTLLIFSFKPESSKYIDFLITTATDSDNPGNHVLRSSSSFMINKIGNYIYDRKSKQNHPMFNELQNLFSLKSVFVSYLRASVNSISKTLNFINYREKEAYRKNMLEANPIPKQYKDNFTKWKWDLIQNLLAFPDPEKFKSSANERYRENKLYKYLLRFYSPSRGSFSQLEWTMQNFLFIKCGRLMVKNSITIPQNLPLVKNPPESQFECTVSFIGDLQKFLQILIMRFRNSSRETTLQFFTTLERSLASFIGYFSENKVGYESLLCENRFFELIYSCIHLQECSHLVFLIIMNLDFYRDDVRKTISGSQQSSIMIGPKALLQKCVRQGSKTLRLGCIEILKILLRTQLIQFSVLAYKLLIYMLWREPEKDESVYIITSFLQENLSNKNAISLFLKVFAQMLSDYEPVSHLLKKDSVNHDFGLLHPDQKSSESRIQEPSIKQSFHNAFTFQEIKGKLTTPIITRFLCTDVGFQLIQNFYPDWLEDEYKKWLSPTHDYCRIVESKLQKCLNFAKKKDKSSYKIIGNANTNIYDLLFLYKLPWVLHLNDQVYPLWTRQVDQGYQLVLDLPIHNSEPCLVSTMNDSLKVMLGIGAMVVDEQFQLASAEQLKSPLSIFLSFETKQTELFGEKLKMTQSHGVEVYYKKWKAPEKQKTGNGNLSEKEEWEQYKNRVNDLNKLQIRRVVINIRVPSTEHMQELPLHLINMLNKTTKGRQFISEKGYLQKCHKILNDFMEDSRKHRNLIEVRSTLWSLGFFGSTSQGMRMIKDASIYQMVVKMSLSCPTLSLRGTCRYIMNMLTHSESGRSLLIKSGFIVNSKSFNCYPRKISEFCFIENTKIKSHFVCESYWAGYQSLLKPLNPNEQKFFDNLSLMMNSYSLKLASGLIREMIKAFPKISNSVNLLQNAILLLTFFRYQHDARKDIMNLFDQLIRSGQFNNEVGGKISFFTPAGILAKSQIKSG